MNTGKAGDDSKLDSHTDEGAIMTDTNAWIENLIAAGVLSPGARGMGAQAAADQHNQANALWPDDAGFLVPPAHQTAERRPTANEPRVWVGCEACYAASQLVGNWYPAMGADAITPEQVHGYPTSHEELVCLDTDNLPIDGEPSTREAARWGEIYEEVGTELWPALCAWVRSGSYTAEGDSDIPVVADFDEAYAGEWGDFAEFAQQLAEETCMFDGLAEDHVAVRYFDWSAWTQDLEMDYSVAQCPSGAVFVFRSL
ncbi:antirestriction protein [Rhodococcus sp. 27YEA15]|uniref:antirestriction protein ArdA n=1 Tax=Rhodococcus sp. 27YEA15 TaxID=3156259 RepID=UPI003C7E9C29